MHDCIEFLSQLHETDIIITDPILQMRKLSPEMLLNFPKIAAGGRYGTGTTETASSATRLRNFYCIHQNDSDTMVFI